MTTVIGQRDQEQQDRTSHYLEIMAGKMIDIYPERLDQLVHELGAWLQSLPEGDCKDEELVRRRSVVMVAFSHLNPREQVAIATSYGLLDGTEPGCKYRYRARLAAEMQLCEGYAAKILKRAMYKLQRVCKSIRSNPILLTSLDFYPETTLIEVMDFSARTNNCLRRLGIVTLGQLEAVDADELMLTRNFGKTSLREVCQKLRQFGRSIPPGSSDYIDIENI